MCYGNDKIDELQYQSCGSFIKSSKVGQRHSTYGTNVYCKRRRGNILSYVNFSKLCHVITNFPELSQNCGQEHVTFPISSSSRAIE